MIGNYKKSKAVLMLFMILCGILLPVGSALAKTPIFRLDMDSLNLEQGVSTQLVLTLTNAKGAEVKSIEGLENFDVLSDSVSTSTQIVNGNITYEEYYSYTIMPKNTGEFLLCGNVEYEGKTYRTNELKVKVSPANSTPGGEVKDVFVKTLLSSEEVYFGQKLVLTYELYSRYSVENFGFLDNVAMDGFIVSTIPEDRMKAEYVYLDGRKYVKYEVRQMYLSPVKTGTFTIPAYNFQVNLSTGDFFRSSKPVYLQTEQKELNVKPLPTDQQPENFSGIVGKLDISSRYSGQEVSYGDSLTLQVTASGNCNLQGLNKIIGTDIPGISVYETVKNTEESVEDGQYFSKKEFEIILVPEKSGEIPVDPIHISYFNPESGRYEQAEIPGITLTVKGEGPKIPEETLREPASFETVKIEQVNYKPQSEGYLTIRLKKAHLVIGLIILVLLILLAASALLFASYRKRHDKVLSELYKQLRRTEDPNEIYNLFNSMFKYRFGLSLKASSRDTIANRLAGRALAGPVLEIMDFMEGQKDRTGKENGYLKDKIKEVYKELHSPFFTNSHNPRYL